MGEGNRSVEWGQSVMTQEVMENRRRTMQSSIFGDDPPSPTRRTVEYQQPSPPPRSDIRPTEVHIAPLSLFPKSRKKSMKVQVYGSNLNQGFQHHPRNAG